MNDKIFIRLIVPSSEVSYEIYLPCSKKIGSIIPLLVNGLKNLGNDIEYNKHTAIYNKLTGDKYGSNDFVSQTDIVDGTELILL